MTARKPVPWIIPIIQNYATQLHVSLRTVCKTLLYTSRQISSNNGLASQDRPFFVGLNKLMQLQICKSEPSLIVLHCRRCCVWQEIELLPVRKKVPVTSINHSTNHINIIHTSLWENTKLTCFLWLMLLFPLASKCFPLVMPLLNCLTHCPTSALHRFRTALFHFVRHKCSSPYLHYHKKKWKKEKNSYKTFWSWLCLL